MGRVWGRAMLSAIADLGRKYLPHRPPGSPVDVAITLCRDLLSSRGEASSVALAREIVDLYGRMSPVERTTFFEQVARAFGPNSDAVVLAAKEFISTRATAAYRHLVTMVEPPTQELFRRLNTAPGAIRTIVKMREHLLGLLPDHPLLAPIDDDLKHLFHSWFNPGFLEFERIDWRTSAAVLEKLIEHELVHEISSWSDLHRRLGEDRRCFAFFHPVLPDEPLIFVEVALVRGLPDAIGPLLEAPTPAVAKAADTAVFYSINNCQRGLVGISFGNFLIKQVVDTISAELTGISTFATLSPVPGFRHWIDEILGDPRNAIISSTERQELSSLAWQPGELQRPASKALLLNLCAHYLLDARRNGHAADPVARFHLGNGASIERVLAGADLSDKGIRQSAGIMVNYLYRTEDIVANHEAYVHDTRIAASASVKRLLVRRHARAMSK
jgi:malonyl-CoA decarboxylase